MKKRGQLKINKIYIGIDRVVGDRILRATNYSFSSSEWEKTTGKDVLNIGKGRRAGGRVSENFSV